MAAVDDTTGILLLRHTDEVVAIRHQVALVLRIVLGRAVVHLGRACGLEYTGHIECERTLELASLRCGAQGVLHACSAVGRTGTVLVDVEAIETAYSAVGAVDIILLLECLVGLQEVVHVVRTEHQAAVGHRHAQCVELTLQSHNVVNAELDALGGGIHCASSHEHRGLVCVLRRTERMGCLGILSVVQGVGVARFDKLGDARASTRGTSDRIGSALFSYV